MPTSDVSDHIGDGYLTTADALVYLRTTARTLYRHLATGDIPGVRVGHQWRFRKSDLDRWLTRDTGSGPVTQTAPTVRPAASRLRRVLVVDDETAVRQMLGKTLRGTGFDVDEVANGSAALEHLRASAYDLVVTDLCMPGLNGTALAREAKRLRPDLKILIVTGYPSEASAIDAVNNGADGYLRKPFESADLLLAAARALSLEGVQREQWFEATQRQHVVSGERSS
jgi:excisionase family DNA binding protein